VFIGLEWGGNVLEFENFIKGIRADDCS
jgi:hypothetical protein